MQSFSANKEEVNMSASQPVNISQPQGPDAKGTRFNFSKTLIEGLHNVPQPRPDEIQARLVHLGPKSKKYTLVLDLDETLVFSSELLIEEDDKDQSRLIIYQRPGASEFLQHVSEKYEVVIFTAAAESYALEAAQVVDPEKRYIKRVLSRDYCVRVKEEYTVKDLRIFADRQLSEVLIADNDPFSFAPQLDHGIPVLPYTGADEDGELNWLQGYLEELYEQPDLIAANKARFGLFPF